MFRSPSVLLNSLIIVLLGVCSLGSAEESECDSAGTPYFSWPFVDGCEMKVRGGTSKGADVSLETQPSKAWQYLQAEGISDFERDRRAILAMVGPYRTSFSFLEVVGYTVPYQPAKPYFSWATEYVYVIEDKGDFISLQHIMAMQYEDAEGNISDPIVMKHWRQDWTYEPVTLTRFQGLDQWQRDKISKKQRQGQWAQEVFQVDDSPRYAGIGQWQHDKDSSVWRSDQTKRPLPRREHSVRDDYDYLQGINQHEILPTGWVHEQHNHKVVAATKASLAKEIGVNRYERIVGHDFSGADDYFAQTGLFWADVRKAWRKIYDENVRFNFTPMYKAKPLFFAMFEGANTFALENYDAAKSQSFIEDALKPRIKP